MNIVFQIHDSTNYLLLNNLEKEKKGKALHPFISGAAKAHSKYIKLEMLCVSKPCCEWRLIKTDFAVAII